MGNQAPSTASREDVVKFYDSLQNWIPEANRIDRVAKITGEEFITKYYNPQKPVILTNMMEDWPAFQVS
jgi:lauroyl/myristoyl acyltransferase